MLKCVLSKCLTKYPCLCGNLDSLYGNLPSYMMDLLNRSPGRSWELREELILSDTDSVGQHDYNSNVRLKTVMKVA